MIADAYGVLDLHILWTIVYGSHSVDFTKWPYVEH